jgi:hypothetical protein
MAWRARLDMHTGGQQLFDSADEEICLQMRMHTYLHCRKRCCDELPLPAHLPDSTDGASSAASQPDLGATDKHLKSL